MPEQNHIPFLHHILPPLQPYLRLLPRRRHASRRQQIIPAHYFRTNKSLLNIAVNFSCRLRCSSSLANRPRSHFRLPRRKKLNQSHQVIRRANQPVQARLFQSIRSQQLRRFLLLHLRQLRFEPPANRHHRRILPPLQRPQLVPSTAVDNSAASSSPKFSTYSIGRCDKNKNPPIDFRSSGVNSNSRSGFSTSKCALHFSSAVFSSSSAGSFFFFKSFSSFSSRRTTWS